MATKADVARLLKAGLTGQEAAKLILQDSWEVDHGRPGFLSQADIQRLKNGLRTQADMQEYNRLIHAYRLVDYTLKDARIVALEAIHSLLLASKELEVYWLEDRLRGIQLITPAIVTQRQYEELKAKQRELELARVWPLGGVLEEVAQQRWPGLWDEYENSDIVELEDFLRQEHPEAFQELLQELISYLKAGQLQPVLLQAAQIAAIQKLEEEINCLRGSHSDGVGFLTPEFDRLQDQKERLIQASYQAGKARAGQQQARLLQLLEKQAAGYLTEEEADLLSYTYCSGAELYKLGLNRWVDEYHPGFDNETGARPAGMVQSLSVAIIQEPRPDEIDERGHYKEPKLLEKVSEYSRHQNLQEHLGMSEEEVLKGLHHNASEYIKSFLAIQATIEAVSDVMGVQFTEDLAEWYQDIQIHAELYNALLEPRGQYNKPPHYLGMPKLQRLKIGRLKPTAKSLRYYRERMAIALGDDWLQEAIKTLDFKPSETGSLAEIMARELKAARLERGFVTDEEASDEEA